VYVAVAAIAALGGCAGRQAAPVIERAPGRPVPVVPIPVVPAAPVVRPAEIMPESYVVKRGETLYGIALDHGLDYRELADWNGISNPNVIRVGDVLRLRPPAAAQSVVQVKPVTSAGAVESRPLGPGSQAAGAAIKPDEITIARIEPRRPDPRPELPPAAVKPDVPLSAAKPDVLPPASGPEPQADEEDRVDWAWPVNGKIVARFIDPGSKGVDIAANLGEPVFASAPGRVVYSGSGLRGYGKLVIIKHNPTYLSAYAHNSQILVKEGQSVVKGQKIGEVGATDTDAPKLHFEIRRLGKPVDPLKFLPERPS
jgi:lipoprotein NlpD